MVLVGLWLEEVSPGELPGPGEVLPGLMSMLLAPVLLLMVYLGPQ
jgi:hypothetical protein